MPDRNALTHVIKLFLGHLKRLFGDGNRLHRQPVTPIGAFGLGQDGLGVAAQLGFRDLKIQPGTLHGREVDRASGTLQKGLGQGDGQTGFLLVGGTVGGFAGMLGGEFDFRSGGELAADAARQPVLLNLGIELLAGGPCRFATAAIEVGGRGERFRREPGLLPCREGSRDQGLEGLHLQIGILLQRHQQRLFKRQALRRRWGCFRRCCGRLAGFQGRGRGRLR